MQIVHNYNYVSRISTLQRMENNFSASWILSEDLCIWNNQLQIKWLPLFLLGFYANELWDI